MPTWMESSQKSSRLVPTKWNLFWRSFWIYLLTVLLGTWLTAGIMAWTSPISFVDLVAAGIAITGVICIPVIPVLFFALMWIYRRAQGTKQKWQYIFALNGLICFLVLFIGFLAMGGLGFVSGNGTHMNELGILFLALPYIPVAFGVIFLINFLYDKNKGYCEAIIFEEDENLLDDRVIMDE